MRSCILQVTRIKCKRKADEDVGSRPSKILRQCLTDESTTIMTKQDLRNLSRCVHRVRRQKYPPAPRDFVELHIAVDKLDTVTCRGEQFCLLNDIPTHTLIFTCNSNLEVLCNDGAEIFADGTFKACVNLYEQLYIIHACVNGHYLPLVFCLLTGKTEQHYVQLWHTIRDRCATLGFQFHPRSANFDFEIAAINAFRSTFPSVATYTCRFHFGQALWRNIQRLGLTDDYKSGTEVGHWLHLFYGLSFLQPDDVSDAFAFDIMSCAPTSDKCDKFSDYFCSTYLESTVFPPSLWAQIPSDTRRTNNGPESFHRHFNAQFTTPHPTFFIFWDEIVKQQTVTYILMNDLHTIAPITTEERRRQQRLFRAWQKFQQQLSSRQQFLRAVGYSYAAVCDL